MSTPNWYELALLALAAWRVFQLIAFDSILDQPRRYVTRLGDWQEANDPKHVNLPKEYREKLGLFINCPYCAGFWIGLAWWGAWQIWPHGTIVVAVPWVISAGVIAGHKLLSSDEG